MESVILAAGLSGVMFFVVGFGFRQFLDDWSSIRKILSEKAAKSRKAVQPEPKPASVEKAAPVLIDDDDEYPEF